MPELRRRRAREDPEKVKPYTNSQIAALIDEHIHNQMHRTILKLRFIDGMTYEKISEHKDVDRTPRQVAYIISKAILALDKYL